MIQQPVTDGPVRLLWPVTAAAAITDAATTVGIGGATIVVKDVSNTIALDNIALVR